MLENKSNDIESRVYGDIAIKDANHFNFDAYIDALSRIILNKENQTPFSIAINGKWGSGKTTLMKTLREKLDSESGQEINRKVKTVFFDAWKYSETDSMLAALVMEILEEMGRKGFIDKLKTKILQGSEKVNIFKQMTDLTKMLTLGFGPEFEKWIETSAYEEKLSFYDIFQDYMKKILLTFVLEKENGQYTDKEGVLVIFIDDLDRCPPKNIIKILESINLFLDQEGCFFIFGMDISLISNAIDLEYKDLDGFLGHDYIKKMIQLQFNLPAIREEDIKEFMETELKIEENLKIYFDIIIQGLESNQREIKRFLNSLNLTKMLGKAIKSLDYEEELLIKWGVLNFSSENFIRSIKTNNNLLLEMQTISNMTTEEKTNHIENLSQYDKELVDKYKNNAKIMNVLKHGGKKFNVSNIPDYIYLSSVAPKEPEEIENIKLVPFTTPIKGKNMIGSNLEGENLKDAFFIEADLMGVNFSGANLTGVKLDKANLSGANLSGAVLVGGTLRHSNLKGTNLRDSKLKSASLIRADLNNADLRYADLKSTTFKGANLKGAKFTNALFNDNTLISIINSQNWKEATFDVEILKRLNEMNKIDNN